MQLTFCLFIRKARKFCRIFEASKPKPMPTPNPGIEIPSSSDLMLPNSDSTTV